VGSPTNSARLLELLAEQTSALEAAHLRLRMTDRLASIGALAAGLGHDMNNVLLPVRAHLEAARTLTMLPEVRRHVEAVQFSVTYLQQLADGLHFLATNPEEDSTDSGPTDLCTWWSNVGPLLVKAVPKHVKVESSFPTGLPAIAISAQGLTQAVLNLVVNAGEAIPADRKRPVGHVRIWAQAAKGGATVTLGVTDNGRGMSAETQRRAFEMFYTTRSRGMGTGLGLPLVAKVVGRARGTVQIESQRGRGTTVMIVVPVAAGLTLPTDAPTAAITIPDGRAKDLIHHLLEVSGVRVVLDSDRPDSKIWVLSPTATALGRARDWRGRHPEGRLVLWGRPSPKSARQWNSLHPVTIEDRNDVGSIAAALRGAIVRS
jgi:nitrogen-specific signal transduction histidine kinase